MIRIFVVLGFLVLVSCQSRNTKQESVITNQGTYPDTVQQKTREAVVPVSDDQSRSSYQKLTNKTNIVILSLNKETDSKAVYVESLEKCNKWVLTKREVLHILLQSEAIDNREWHYLYDVYPCYYSGDISIDGKLASYSINAGAFSTLRFKDTSINMGYKKNDFKRFFFIRSRD